jgi:ParB family chromosome partitioning protein
MRHDVHYVEELSRSIRTVGKMIPVDRISPNPEQPRVDIGDLTELADSIREKGVLEPLLVRPNKDGSCMIIAGERRWRASQLAGLIEVPCIELDIDDRGVAEIALIENLQRKDLSIWEEADGLKALAERFGYTQEDIAQKISKSRTTVTELMTIAGLPAEIRDKCHKNKISAKSTLLEIARQFDEAAMHDHLERIVGPNGKGQTTKPSEKKSAGKSGSTGNIPTVGKFTYQPSGAEFKVEVTFSEPDQRNKRGILEALKRAFEDVKNDVVET